jgi:hypothetical protein
LGRGRLGQGGERDTRQGAEALGLGEDLPGLGMDGMDGAVDRAGFEQPCTVVFQNSSVGLDVPI